MFNSRYPQNNSLFRSRFIAIERQTCRHTGLRR